MVTYKAMLYIPAHASYDFYTRDFEKGLQLYSSGVLIMDKCPDLLPDHFRFVRGVVDSPDFSLNLSREMLQHDRQLKVIATNLEKKIKAELLKILKDDREGYEKFWKAFGLNLKYGVVADYGAHKDMLQDLLLFWSSKEDKQVTLAEYRQRMPESQQFIYYVCAESTQRAARLPQVERIRDAGFEILYLTEEVDEFVVNALGEVDGKAFKSVAAEDALPQTDEEKAALEKKAEENKDVLEFIKQTLGDKIKEARISKILKSGGGGDDRRRPGLSGDGALFPKDGRRRAYEGRAGAGAQPRLGGLCRPARRGGERQGEGGQIRRNPLRPGPADRRTAPGRPGAVYPAGVQPDELMETASEIRAWPARATLLL